MHNIPSSISFMLSKKLFYNEIIKHLLFIQHETEFFVIEILSKEDDQFLMLTQKAVSGYDMLATSFS